MEKRKFRDTIYLVSSCGRVWNGKRGNELVVNYGSGYGLVKLSIGEKGNKKEKTFLIHRVVAECYLERVDGKNEINHKDGDKRNNRVENLEWCTRSENMNHAYVMGLIEINPANWVRGLKPRKKKERGLDFVVDEIRQRVLSGESYEDLAKEFGVSRGLIYSASNGRNGYKISGDPPAEIKRRENKEKRDLRAKEVLERKKERERIKMIKVGLAGKDILKANWDILFE